MKNTIFAAIIALFFSTAISAQSTVDSITAKYQLQPMPEALTVEKAFPVVGAYQVTAGENQFNVIITLDSVSKGIVWVEGLPEGKFKAFLKKSPTYYRVISQKLESGKQLPEGTLIYDAEANTLNIAFGKAYNDEEPTAIFATTTTTADPAVVKTSAKSKSKAPKVTIYTGAKIIAQESTTENAAKENQEQKAPEQEQEQQ